MINCYEAQEVSLTPRNEPSHNPGVLLCYI